MPADAFREHREPALVVALHWDELVVAAGLLALGVVDFRLFVSVEEELAGEVALPPPGLQTRQAVRPRSFASVSVASHPVCAYQQVERWYFAPVLVTKTLDSVWAQTPEEIKNSIPTQMSFLG